jgi:hypothetical protein
MSIEANKALVRRFFDEAINQRKLEILDEILGILQQMGVVPPLNKG